MSLSLFVPLENRVNKEHPSRKFISLLNFEELTKPLMKLENTAVGRCPKASGCYYYSTWKI